MLRLIAIGWRVKPSTKAHTSLIRSTVEKRQIIDGFVRVGLDEHRGKAYDTIEFLLA